MKTKETNNINTNKTKKSNSYKKTFNEFPEIRNTTKVNYTQINLQALKVAALFAIAGILWILFSDRLTIHYFKNISNYSEIQTYKGLFYVLAVSFIIFLLLRSQLKKIYKVSLSNIVSERRFRTYINAAPIGIYIVNEEGKYIDANKTGTEFLGYEKDELMQCTIEDIVFPEDSKIALSGFAQLIETGKMDEEIRYIKKDKSSGWWRIVAVKLDEHNFLGFTIEISEQKNAENELRKQHEQLEIIVKERTANLQEKNKQLELINKELENINNLFLGREFRIKELNEQILKLENEIKNNNK